MPTEEVELQRRVIAERTQLVSQMTQLKNRIQSILHANLIPQETGRIFGKKGRGMPLHPDQMRIALSHHNELERQAAEPRTAAIERSWRSAPGSAKGCPASRCARSCHHQNARFFSIYLGVT
jgi:transposase